jgi:DNA replication protein DnaC
MLIEQTIEKLSALKLRGMLAALEGWHKSGPEHADIAPTDLVGLLTEAEWTERENRRLLSRLREARFRDSTASVEAIDYTAKRGLRKAQILELAGGGWIKARQNLLMTGATGTGKTFLACALAHQACRQGTRVLYTRTSRFLGDLQKARLDGTYARLLQRIQKTELLILDDFDAAPLDGNERRDLREVMDDRYDLAGTLVTSQMEPPHWHAFIGDETLADAILDRLLHNAHRIKLAGESLRKTKGIKPSEGQKEGGTPGR